MKPIEGYENYFVLESGEIWNKIKNDFVKQRVGTHGYKVVSLTNGKKSSEKLVHRIVAKAYCEGEQEGYVVDHIDGNKWNNHAENLRWCTQKENVRNQIERGTHNYDEAHKAARIARRKPIRVIFPDGRQKEYPASIDACKELGLSPSKVSQVLSGKRTHHKGFYFERIDS